MATRLSLAHGFAFRTALLTAAGAAWRPARWALLVHLAVLVLWLGTWHVPRTAEAALAAQIDRMGTFADVRASTTAISFVRSPFTAEDVRRLRSTDDAPAEFDGGSLAILTATSQAEVDAFVRGAEVYLRDQARAGRDDSGGPLTMGRRIACLERRLAHFGYDAVQVRPLPSPVPRFQVLVSALDPLRVRDAASVHLLFGAFTRPLEGVSVIEDVVRSACQVLDLLASQVTLLAALWFGARAVAWSVAGLRAAPGPRSARVGALLGAALGGTSAYLGLALASGIVVWLGCWYQLGAPSWHAIPAAILPGCVFLACHALGVAAAAASGAGRAALVPVTVALGTWMAALAAGQAADGEGRPEPGPVRLALRSLLPDAHGLAAAGRRCFAESLLEAEPAARLVQAHGEAPAPGLVGLVTVPLALAVLGLLVAIATVALRAADRPEGD
ncbi:MAG: hypothetical protein IT458_05690 [Planctomycetes bacterium]|nr:hypothetical protein [Planctomycetota bacterium]